MLAAARAALGVALLAAAAVAPRALRAQDAERDQIASPEVARLRFRGVSAVDQTELEKSISTTASHCRSVLLTVFCAATKSPLFFRREYLNHAELRRDVLRIKVFYFRRGYRETTVDTVVRRIDRKQVAIRINIVEGEPTRLTAVTVAGADSIVPPKVKKKRMLIADGSVLNLFKVDSSVLRLQESLWNAGYADGKVDTSLVVDAEARTATFTATLVPSWLTRVGSVQVTGNHDVATSTILHTLSFAPGDVYRRDDVVRSQRSLYESNLFRRAVIPPATGDSIKAVTIDVTEAPLHEAQVTAGANTFEFLQVSGRYTSYNFGGGARRLDVRAAIGNLFASGLQRAFLFKSFSSALDNEAVGVDKSKYLLPTWNLSADVTQPFVGSPKNTLSAGLFANRRAAPGVFVDRSQGATATFTRLVTDRAPVSLNYRFEVSGISAGQVYFCVNYGACDLPTVGLLQKKRRLSPLSLLSNVDRTNDPFNPTSGFRANASIEHASAVTASDYRYNRATAEGAVYRPMGGRVLAAHLRMGYVGAIGASSVVLGAASDGGVVDVLHPRKRFYAGGSQSVRGFGENQLGPRVLTIDPAVLRGRHVVKGKGAARDTVVFDRCAPSVPIEQCPLDRTLVNAASDTITLNDDRFTPRATGGTTLIEGSVELRFPLVRIAGQPLGGVAFVDAGSLGSGSLGSTVKGNAAVTPGVGIRYASPVGAVRVDVGWQPTLSEELCVVTQDQTVVPGSTTDLSRPAGDDVRSTRDLVYVGSDARSGGANSCTRGARRTFAPLQGKNFPAHLVLHLSIGQAF